MLKNNERAIEIPCHLYNNPRKNAPMIATVGYSSITCAASSKKVLGVLAKKKSPKIKETQKIFKEFILPDFCDGSFCRAAKVLKTKARSDSSNDIKNVQSKHGDIEVLKIPLQIIHLTIFAISNLIKGLMGTPFDKN